MGLIPTLNTFVPGTPIRASTVNENFDRIVTVVNGQLDDINILQISAEKVTSGEFDLDRLPRAAQGFLKATGTGTSPNYELVQWGDVQDKPSTFPPEGHKHDAGDIDSGRLDLARLPTSGTANRFLKVGTANSTPEYSTILWADVQSKPSAFPPVAHSHPISNITGLQSALDGKAPTSHSHSLTSASITGVAPLSKLPVGFDPASDIAPGLGAIAVGETSFRTNIKIGQMFLGQAAGKPRGDKATLEPGDGYNGDKVTLVSYTSSGGTLVPVYGTYSFFSSQRFMYIGPTITDMKTTSIVIGMFVRYY